MSRPWLAAITLDPKGGGVSAVSRLLWQALQQRAGKDPRLITLVDDGRPQTSLESSTGARLRFGAQLARVQATRQCDWIFFTHLSVARVQAFVPPLIRRRYAVFIHGIEVWRPLTAEHLRVLRGAALRVANSAFTAKRVTAMHPDIGAVDPCLLSLPPETPESLAATIPLEVDFGPHAVILVARMSAAERYKGHDELLSAWRSVAERVPDARLVFVGDGDDSPRLREKAAALGVAPSVIFTGFVSESELQAIYRKAAVFAMPSRAEGFGLVYLEAMAQRLPCIGGVEDAAGEIIVDGVTGFLVAQSDDAGLANRLVQLLTNEALRVEMGGAGYRRQQERFTYEHFSRTLLSLTESTLDSPAPAWRRDVAL